MSTTWQGGQPTVVAPPSSFGDASAHDPRVGRGPWPLAPLTVPAVVFVATLVGGGLLARLVPELPWAEDLRPPGTFTAAFVLAFVITAALVALSMATRARPSVGRAAIGTAATAAAFAGLATIANAVTESLGFELRFPPSGFFDDEPLKASISSVDLLSTSFIDQSSRPFELFDTFFSPHQLVALLVLFAVLGAGATLACNGTVRSAALAGALSGLGAVAGEVFVTVGTRQQFEWFVDDLGLPTVLTLAPFVLAGIGIGVGALLGRPHAPKAPVAAAAAPVGAWSPAQTAPPPPAGVQGVPAGPATAPMPTIPSVPASSPAPAAPPQPVVTGPSAPLAPGYTPASAPPPPAPGTGEPPPT